jgi:CRP/FNR family cyclic AMP-dependent transcriptional regulator
MALSSQENKIEPPRRRERPDSLRTREKNIDTYLVTVSRIVLQSRQLGFIRVQEWTMPITGVLKEADIFYELTNTQLELVASICKEKTYQQGALIFAENTTGDELYVIADGEVKIEVDPALIGRGDAGGPQAIATLRRGQSFGEVALVDQGVRSAAARCARHGTRLLIIPRDKLMLLCDTYPQLGYRLMRNLAADLAMKIRNTDLQIREQLTWVSPHAE